MLGLHPRFGGTDERVRRLDDVRRGTVVLGEKEALGAIVLLELADELHGCAVERVDVLVVVAHHQEVLLVVGVSQCSTR